MRVWGTGYGATDLQGAGLGVQIEVQIEGTRFWGCRLRGSSSDRADMGYRFGVQVVGKDVGIWVLGVQV